MQNEKEYALIFKALSDESRIKIMNLLCNSELSMTEMLAELELSQPTISYHISIMKEAGLICSNRCGTVKKCSINFEKLKEINQWFTDICDESF